MRRHKYNVRVTVRPGELIEVARINADTVDDAVSKFWKHIEVAKVWSWSITDPTSQPTWEFLHSREEVAELKATGTVYTQKVGEPWNCYL